MKFKIALILPLGLFFLSLSFSLLFYWQTLRQASEIIHEQELTKVKLDITRLQNILYNLLTEDHTDIESARLNLSVTAMDNNIKTLLLASETNKIVIANRYNWEGGFASEFSNYQAYIAESIRKSNAPNVFYADESETLLSGYYPVVLKLESVKGLPIKKRGVLYVEYSLVSKLNRAESIAVNQSVFIAAALFGVSVLLALLLHFIISKRLLHLRSVANEVSSGNLKVKSSLGGHDELAELSSAFDEMIEKRRDAERELHHVNENLEDIVESRTAELEEKKEELLATQAHAHHANKMAALGEMAGGMAHEINSPLQAILLSTFRLKKDKLSENTENRLEIANNIESRVYDISNIIESLRRMSRGTSSDPYDNVELKDIIDNVVGISKERYVIKGILFETRFHKDCESEHIYCQQTLISQVIVNLVNNAYDAVKNLDDKWITIDVYTDKENVEISVTDSGQGISEIQRVKIFEPMYTTKTIEEGTGLGLSISVDIARQHKGTLKLDTASANTRFVLTIPRIKKV